MGSTPPESSLLAYYQANRFNPVPLSVEDQAFRESHFAKRFNLYQRHLHIPLGLLRGQAVLEFGCNSGENALVLASVGAHLTLVEPNDQVHPRLRELFRKFDLTAQISSLLQQGVDEFESDRKYDLVLAEGFLYTLNNRDAMLRKVADQVAPHGLGVVSFNDRWGSLVEMTKRYLLWRTCHLSGVGDVHDSGSLTAAQSLFQADYEAIKTSRPFAAWWKDTLVNPFYVDRYLWSYAEVLDVIAPAGCEVYSVSPPWVDLEAFRWYKDVSDAKSRKDRFLEAWRANFSFMATGIRPDRELVTPVPQAVSASLEKLIAGISELTQTSATSPRSIEFPAPLAEYFAQASDPALRQFGAEMSRLYEAAAGKRLEEVVSTFRGASRVRSSWGTPYHYLCFTGPT